MKKILRILKASLFVCFVISYSLFAQKPGTPIISGGLDKGDCISRVFINFKSDLNVSDYIYNVYYAEGETKDLNQFKYVGSCTESNGGAPIGILVQGLGNVSTIYVTAYNKEFESDISNLLVIKLKSCSQAGIIKVAGSIEGLMSKISTPRLLWAGDKGFCNARILMENVDNPYKTKYHVYHAFGKTNDLKDFQYLGAVGESNSSGMPDIKVAGILVENIPGISSVYVICELEGEKSEMSNILTFEVAKNEFCKNDNPPKISIISENTSDLNENIYSEVKIYPNPADSKINILLDNENIYTSYEIYDLVGNLVMKDDIVSNPLIINAEKIKIGNYLIKILSKNTDKHYLFKIVR